MGIILTDNTIDIEDKIDRYYVSAPTHEEVIDAITYHQGKARHIPIDSLRGKGRVVRDSFESYLGSGGIQSSHVKKALISAQHYCFAMDDDTREIKKLKEKKPGLDLGTFIHQCVLEPTLFSRAKVEPKVSLASNEGVLKAIKWWEQHVETIPISDTQLFNMKIDAKRDYLEILKKGSGIIPLNEYEHATIMVLKGQLDRYGNGIVKKLVTHAHRETSFYMEDKESGLTLKVRPDAIQFKENIGVDCIISLKSTSADDLDGFYRQCANLKYDLTEAMYQDVVSEVTGREFRTTITVMMQTVEPFAVALCVWDADDIAWGRYRYTIGMETIRKVHKTGIVPGYDSYAGNDWGLIPMKMPAWANKEVLNRE